MNRETWFRLLQVAVIAPYLYHRSEKESGYFKIGLKLVAAAVIVRNVPPLVAEVQPLIAAAAKMKADAEAIAAREKVDAIEGEFTAAPSDKPA